MSKGSSSRSGKKSLDSYTHTLSGKKLINNMLYKPAGLGEKTLREIYSKEQLDELVKFAKALEITQESAKEVPGKMWIQLAQGSAIASMGAGIAMDSDLMKGGSAIILFETILKPCVINIWLLFLKKLTEIVVANMLYISNFVLELFN